MSTIVDISSDGGIPLREQRDESLAVDRFRHGAPQSPSTHNLSSAPANSAADTSNARRLVPLGRWLVAVAVSVVAVWLTWELVRPQPYTGGSTRLGWPGVGFDPNVPFDREYGFFGYLRSRNHYTDYFNGRQVSGERLEWRDRQSAYTIAVIALVWLAAGRAVTRLTAPQHSR